MERLSMKTTKELTQNDLSALPDGGQKRENSDIIRIHPCHWLWRSSAKEGLRDEAPEGGLPPKRQGGWGKVIQEKFGRYRRNFLPPGAKN